MRASATRTIAIASESSANGSPFAQKEEQVEREVITPKTAAKMLEWSARNRRISERSVDLLVTEIVNHKWDAAASVIRINKAGELIDGQHRLTACIKAKMPIESYIIYGCEHESQEKMDVGRSRMASDILMIEGKINATCLAATLRRLHCIDEEDFLGNGKIAVWQLKEVLARHPITEEIVNKAKTQAKWLANAGICAALVLLHEKDLDDAKTFMSRLFTGEDLVAKNPILVLRNMILQERGVLHKKLASRNEATRQSAIVIKSWNAWRQRKEIGHLRFGADERFPTPI